MPSDKSNENLDSRHRSLFTAAWISAIVSAVVVVLLIIFYFIWPYSPNVMPMEDIYALIQEQPFAAIWALDTGLVIGMVIPVCTIVGLYVVLRNVNPGWALAGLILASLAIAASFPTRPVVELFALSDLYAGATTETARAAYIAAGEALIVMFNGTAWVMMTVLNGVAWLVNCSLMLRSSHFSKLNAWIGIVTNVFALSFWLPGAAALILLIATFSGIAFMLFMARDFRRLEKQASGS